VRSLQLTVPGTIAAKLKWLRNFRFNVQPENAPSRTKGYTTEKVPEAHLAHAVPVTWGDPGDEEVGQAGARPLV
jgi:hypothetical protein